MNASYRFHYVLCYISALLFWCFYCQPYIPLYILCIYYWAAQRKGCFAAFLSCTIHLISKSPSSPHRDVNPNPTLFPKSEIRRILEIRSCWIRSFLFRSTSTIISMNNSTLIGGEICCVFFTFSETMTMILIP